MNAEEKFLIDVAAIALIIVIWVRWQTALSEHLFASRLSWRLFEGLISD